MKSPYSVTYQDENFIALNKSSGFHSVALDGSEYSLAAALLEQFPDLSHVGHKPGEAGLLSRLDFDTSGLLIAAKESSSFQSLKNLMRNNGLQKLYLAVVKGEFPRQKQVNAMIGSRYRRSQKVHCFDKTPQKKFRAREAQTFFSLLSFNSSLNISLVSARFFAGRRHQVRAHAAHCGHPLLGDELYAGGNQRPWGSEPEFLLHSSELVIKQDNVSLELKAPLPEYFEIFVNEYF